MTLVIKNKLSNVTGNKIITFFNKYANLPTSPLLKNIQQGCIFMDNIKKPNLEFHKTCILNYKDVKYFLYYVPLISCIKNIVKIPDISQYFAYSFEVSYRNEQIF